MKVNSSLPNDKETPLDLRNYIVTDFIGQGAFSKVFLIENIHTKDQCAAKIYESAGMDNKNSNRFYRQKSTIPLLSHPSIAKYIGNSPVDFNNQNNPMIITKYYPHGSLKRIIELQRKNQLTIPFNITNKLIIIYGIASAMSYLHSKNIIHRDLKPDNVLLNNNYFPIIADFGMSRNILQEENTEDQILGAPLYMAPEIWNNLPFTKKSDVYSYGMLVYELFTDQNSFEKLDNIQLCLKVGIQKERPEFTDLIPPVFQRFIEKCWDDDPNNRPSFEWITNELRTNKDFIIKDVNEALYYTYIEIIEDEKRGIDTTTKRRRTFSVQPPPNSPIHGESSEEIKKILENLKIDEIDLNCYEKVGLIGRGGFGCVYLIEDKKTGEKFAAKEFKASPNKKIDFLRELKINLCVNHPSIIKLIGCSLTGFYGEPTMIIVTKYIPNGSLERILRNERNMNSLPPEVWNQTMKLINIYGIASALLYLHQNHILHLDVKPDNVLLTKLIWPILCDFSISLKIENDQLIERNIGGTYPFISPEVIRCENPTTKSDVYSFGMLLYELLSNMMPFKGMPTICIIYSVVFKNERPLLDNSIVPVFQRLIEKCWDDDPNNRPSFEWITNELRTNKEFITKDVDEKLYHSYIEIIDEKINGVNTIFKDFSLYRSFDLDSVYKELNIKYEDNIQGKSLSSECSKTDFLTYDI